MLWQAFAGAAVVAGAFENVVDKAATVGDQTIPYDVATFWRTSIFVAFAALAGSTGLLGPVRLSFPWPIVAFALLVCLPGSFFYTHLLKRVEVASVGVATYLAPIAFLMVDTLVLRLPLSHREIAGILLLAAGGATFVLDGRTGRLKAEISPPVLAIFAFNLVAQAIQFYLFKRLAADGVNGVSFILDVWILVSVAVLAVVAARGRLGLLVAPSGRLFVARSAIGKACDALNSLFWVQALLLATVSQVSAVEAFAPAAIVAAAFCVQRILRLDLGERGGRANLAWKGGSVAILCAGGVLVG